MRVLLTGATGYLGRNLLGALLAQGDECLCLTRRGSDLSVLGALAGQVARLDAQTPLPDDALRGLDAVIHLAASYGRAGESMANVARANLILSIELLEAAHRAGVRTFFYASTTINRDTNAYSLSKLQAVEWGRLVEQNGGPRFVELALEHFYGPGDSPTKFTTFVFEALAGDKPDLNLSPGGQRRDFIYIDDAVAALVAIAGRELQATGPGTRWAVGSGEGVLLKDFVTMARDIAGAQTRLNFGALAYRRNETMSSVADIAPLKALGWTPRTSLRDGMLRCMQFFKQEVSGNGDIGQ